MNRHERRQHRRYMVEAWEKTLPPELTPEKRVELEEMSRGRIVIFRGEMPPDGTGQTFSNELGTFNVWLLGRHIEMYPRMYGPIKFPVHPEFVRQVTERYDVDPRHLGPVEPLDELEPVVVVRRSATSYWIVDGTHRFLRLAKAGRRKVDAWSVSEDVVMRFRMVIFQDGREMKRNLEEVKRDYGVYVDRDGKVAFGDTVPEAERTRILEAMEQMKAQMQKVTQESRDGHSHRADHARAVGRLADRSRDRRRLTQEPRRR